MKKYTGVIVVLCIYVFLYLMPIIDQIEFPDNDNYARITNFEYKAELVDEVNSQGKVIITEKITYDIHVEDYDKDIWELWRDLPESELDGVRNSYKVNYVKEIKPDGNEIIYTESNKLYWYDDDYINTEGGYGPGKWYYSPGPYNEYLNQYECVLFYVNGLTEGQITFEIQYEMTGAAFGYADCSYLYLTFFSGPDVKYLNSFKAEVLIRNKDMPKAGNYEAYNYGTVNMHYPYEESKTKYPGYHTFTMSLDKDDLKFDRDSQFLEFEMWAFNEDAGIFSEYAPINWYTDDNALDEIRQTQQEYYAIPVKKARIKALTLIVCSTIGIFIAFDAFTKDKRIRKKYIFCSPTQTVLQYREVPSNMDPYFAANLVFCKDNKKFNENDAYSAILLSLVRKDYLELVQINEINDWSYNNVKIVVKYRPKPITTFNDGYSSVKRNQWFTTQNMNFYSNRVNGNVPNMYSTTSYQPGKYATSVVNEVENLPVEDQKTYEPLTLTEQYYFNLIIRHVIGNEISMVKLQQRIEQDYENTDTFARNIENSVSKIGVSQGYFQRANYKQPRNNIILYSNILIFIAIILLVVFNFYTYSVYGNFAYGAFTYLSLICIISSIHLKKIAPQYVLLTRIGEDEYAKWRAFYEFLNSENFMNDKTIVELSIWEQYLVYATAFGLSDKISKAIGIRCPNIQESKMLRNRYYRSHHFRHNHHHFRNATRRASSISRSGGYSYSSGGRGGGGGGGGH